MFSILSSTDKPLYEKLFQSKRANFNQNFILNAYFQLHSSLDILEEKLVNQKEIFIKEIDQQREFKTYAYVTPTNIRFLLMTDQDEEKVKGFFMQAHEQFIRILMNPLYEHGSPITSLYFDYQIQQLIQNKLNS